MVFGAKRAAHVNHYSPTCQGLIKVGDQYLTDKDDCLESCMKILNGL